MENLMEFLSPELSWFIAGFIFFMIEMGTVSFFMVFFGFAAWITMLTTWIFDLSFEAQLIEFILLSVISLIFFRKKLKAFMEKTSDSKNVEVDSDFVGHIAQTTETVSASGGYVLFNGTKWKAISDEEIEAEKTVKIIQKDNITLKVKKI
jgi:membrane protein implicated in regulation of membrane protease activity